MASTKKVADLLLVQPPPLENKHGHDDLSSPAKRGKASDLGSPISPDSGTFSVSPRTSSEARSDSTLSISPLLLPQDKEAAIKPLSKHAAIFLPIGPVTPSPNTSPTASSPYTPPLTLSSGAFSPISWLQAHARGFTGDTHVVVFSEGYAGIARPETHLETLAAHGQWDGRHGRSPVGNMLHHALRHGSNVEDYNASVVGALAAIRSGRRTPDKRYESSYPGSSTGKEVVRRYKTHDMVIITTDEPIETARVITAYRRDESTDPLRSVTRLRRDTPLPAIVSDEGQAIWLLQKTLSINPHAPAYETPVQYPAQPQLSPYMHTTHFYYPSPPQSPWGYPMGTSPYPVSYAPPQQWGAYPVQFNPQRYPAPGSVSPQTYPYHGQW